MNPTPVLTTPVTPVPILRSVAAAYAFLISHWQRALIAAAPFTLVYLAQLMLMQAIGDATANPAISMAAFLLSLVAVVASLALSAACLRMAVLGDYSGWHSLKAGADEGRIFIVALLTIALLAIVFVLALMFWAAVFNAAAGGALINAGLDPQTTGMTVPEAVAYFGQSEWAVVIAVGLVGVGVLAWFVVRLVLGFAATIAQGRVIVLKAWPLSHGNAPRIAAAVALAALPLVVIETGLYEFLCAVTGSRFLHQQLPVGAGQTDLPAMAAIREYMRWFVLMAFINVPVFSGLYAYIYRNRIAAAAAGDGAA